MFADIRGIPWVNLSHDAGQGTHYFEKTACLTDLENRHFWLLIDPGLQIIAWVDLGFLRFMHRVLRQSPV